MFAKDPFRDKKNEIMLKLVSRLCWLFCGEDRKADKVNYFCPNCNVIFHGNVECCSLCGYKFRST